MAAEFPLNIIIRAVDKLTAPLRAITARMERLTAPARRVAAAFRAFSQASGVDRLSRSLGGVVGGFRNLGGAVANVVGRIGIALGAMGYLFKNQFVDTAAEFETFRTVLETIEGSSSAASKSMAWISDFAAKTPYELAQVTEAFVKLRAYGMDPTDGLLTTLGDTASAMGKPLMSAVEAIADAMTGENERLKEFGIRATKSGDKITYEYMQNGKTMTASAKASSREQILAVLSAILNPKYAGAMDKQSRTWKGMISNLSDQWARFTNMTMDAGLFDFLRKKLEGLLAAVNRMADNGSLQEWAERLGGAFTRAFTTIADAVPRIATVVQDVAKRMQPLADMVGGWPMLLGGIAAAIVGGPILAALATLTGAVITLGAALLATPVGWVIGAVAIIAGAVFLIYRNWEKLPDFFLGIWDRVAGVFKKYQWAALLVPFIGPIATIYNNWGGITGFFRGLWDGVKTIFTDSIGWIAEKIDWLLKLPGK
ncbi:phage tail tape-measure protein, partial [Rhodoligotrophos appendicifer]